MAGGGILGLATSGLAAYQRALKTTSHNIANVNSEGYTRQRVEFTARTPEIAGNGFVGTGVEVETVTRIYDQFLAAQVRDGTSGHNEMDTYYNLASRIDNLLADPQAGLMPGMEGFFSAVGAVANDPSSQPARQVMLTEAQNLVSRFKFLDKQLASLDQSINAQLRSSVTEINALSSNIGDLNNQIVRALGASSGQPPNDLLDQRDELLAKLAEKVTVTTVTQDDGAVNVFVGNGQALVAGAITQQLAVIGNRYDATRYEIAYQNGSGTTLISGQLRGGILTGLLNFRDQVLDPARNALGRVALSVAQDVNRQHALGMDLYGQQGGDFFSVPAVKVQPHSGNTGAGAVNATITSTKALSASDYMLSYNGANSYTLTRLTDSRTFSINTGGASPYTAEEVDGVSLAIAAGAAAGDTFLIRPSRNGAAEIGLAFSDTRRIAAAAPVRSAATYTNVGNGAISAVRVNSPNDPVTIRFTTAATYDVIDDTTGMTLAQNMSYASGGNISFDGWTAQITNNGGPPAAGDEFHVDGGETQPGPANTGGAVMSPAAIGGADPDLTDPVTITFTGATTFNVTGATTGTPTTGLTYTPGQPLSFNGWTVTLTGAPVAGDSFTLGPNTNGTGDNRNALALAAMQKTQTMSGGTATYAGSYGQLVADIGARTSEAKINRDARGDLLGQIIDDRDRMSGVNLDEEAANLMRFQQAYQAVAQLVTVSNTLFDSLLSAFQR